MSSRLTPLFAAISTACAGVSSPDPSVGEGDPILFVGNSHTYVNDLPRILQALADSGGTKIAVASVANPNFALIDHWNDGAAASAISQRHWKFVVLQQGWTPAGVCQDTLRLATQRFAGVIRRSGGQPALYQVWPPSNRPEQYPGTIESYRLAAKDVDGVLLPVAEAWRVVQGRDPSLDLYLDGLHANATGSYLTALVIYARLFHHSPVGLPASLRTRAGQTIQVPVPTAELLQAVAAEIGLAPTPDEPPGAIPVVTSVC
jgi:hypothetical protein